MFLTRTINQTQKIMIKKTISYINITPLFLLITSICFISCSNDDKNTSNEEMSVDASLSCQFTVGDDYIVFDAESTESDLGEWKLINKGDENYLDNAAVIPINETHLEFTGNNTSSGPPSSPLTYTFTAPTTGTYKLFIRLYQRLEGLEEDKCNDVYIKLAGDFVSGTDQYTTNDLKTDLKFFGRGVDQWGSCYAGDGGELENKSAILYNLIKGKNYTFTMSGRSQRANIDYILLYDTSIDINGGANKDIAALNDAQYRPDWSCSQ